MKSNIINTEYQYGYWFRSGNHMYIFCKQYPIMVPKGYKPDYSQIIGDPFKDDLTFRSTECEFPYRANVPIVGWNDEVD